jgi:hypothetical protein
MGKYLLLLNNTADGIPAGFGLFETKIAAYEAMKKIVTENNTKNNVDMESGLSYFDFSLREVQGADMIGLVITSFEKAKEYLKPKTCSIMISEKHKKAIEAFDKLLTIGEAWNALDGFVPDMLNEKQAKYYVSMDIDATNGNHCYSGVTKWDTTNCPEGLLFSTQDIARRFGKMFENLYSCYLNCKK